jgi:16S rRNA (guanine966-N2)-methyltransferase
VRVVAGRFGGRRLVAPRGRATRPTADRVREALFSMLGDVSHARVLDLYAGSGALGIEALSRGAQSALFVDSDARAVAVIRRNLTELGADGEVRRQDVVRFLRAAAAGRTASRTDDIAPARAEPAPSRTDDIAPARAEPAPSRTTFDLVFCDPPYDLAPSPAGALAEHLPAMTSDHARIVTESDKRRPLELPLPLLRERTYGDTRIAIHGG